VSDTLTIQRELRSALAHLNDLTYLESHLLAHRLSFIDESPGTSRGHVLRRTLRAAIEALDPGGDVPGEAPEARAYQVLYRYAISRHSMVTIALDLNISRRQAYRELQQSTEALAKILAVMDLPSADDAVPGEASVVSWRAARLRDELERLDSVGSQDVDLVELVRSAVASVQYLADQRALHILMSCEREQVPVRANRVMLRQAVIGLLSHITRVHQGDKIGVELSRLGDQASLSCRYLATEADDSAGATGPLAIALQLLATLRMPCSFQRDGESAVIRVQVPLVARRQLLIVDDNEGTIALFRRYLRQETLAIYSATSGTQALEMIAQQQPDVILLDVMMPVRDGWEVLESLRADEGPSRPRVIVCSVIDDPQLAAALGADAFLHKPVSRKQLLQAVASVTGEGS
jgi:CheY-like chemotaxis protein